MTYRQQGFTLMELMIAVAIVGILAAIAYPSYRDQVRRSNRAEAKIALEERAQRLEKCYTRFMSYNNLACAAASGSATTENGNYSVSVNPTLTQFTITATPQGAQADDNECNNFTLTETGTRGISGTGTVARCW